MPALLRNFKPLTPVRPSAPLEILYRQRLDALLHRMDRSLLHWLRVSWRANPPEMVERLAQDDSPARSMVKVMRRLTRYWTAQFDELAPALAVYFAEEAAKRSDAALTSILRRGGMSVRFTMGRAANDVLQATVAENVALIRSIGQQHLNQVEQMVMRSVQAGRDLHSLAEGLEKQLGVSRRRAALIARDQNNKATAAIQRVRQVELGVTEAIWVHSGGGRVPRPSHARAGRDKVRYDVRQGWYDPDEKQFIFPGQLVNCRCVSRPIVPGFS